MPSVGFGIPGVSHVRHSGVQHSGPFPCILVAEVVLAE